MTGSNDPMSTGYPMSSSGDVLSSSLDLDMKFDHFGESTTNIGNLDTIKDFNKIDDVDVHAKKVLKRTEAVYSKDAPEFSTEKNMDSRDIDDVKDSMDSQDDLVFEVQHLSDIFVLMESHNDPQVRGLVRICIGNYLSAALDLSHGDYYRWRNFSVLPKDVSENITTDKLVGSVLKRAARCPFEKTEKSSSHVLHATHAAFIGSKVYWRLYTVFVQPGNLGFTLEAYVDQGIVALCLDHLDCCNNTVPMKTILLDLCTLLYPVEVSNVMNNRQSNRDIFERDAESVNEKWHHLEGAKCANLAEKFLQDWYCFARVVQYEGKLMINLEPKTSMFYQFMSKVLDALAIQLELATEREFVCVIEEILYYLKVIMPLRADKTVFCVTQLLKCLFGTNMANQYSDYMSIADIKVKDKKSNLFDAVMMVNSFNNVMKEQDNNSRRGSTTSGASLKLIDDNPRMTAERQMLMKLENFAKNKSDKKWSTNKKELERYIKLFEPVVIQALKSYTMQNDIPLQCKVLSLLNQLLTLRVNYCMLDSEQIFIGFLLKQLELVEQHEIPDCCDLVNHILMFLVQLSSSKHHTKQIIEVPKLIQLCDGLMASGAHAECVSAIQPLSIKVFWGVGTSPTLGRAPQQELQVTKEVVFYMLQKTMHDHKVLDLVACLLALSQEHPESYYGWSELACDTLLNLLGQRSLEIDTSEAISCLEKLVDSVYKDVLLEQSRVELLLKILFKAPPDQSTTPYKLRLRYLSITMVLLRKILVCIPETDILLSINYLKASHISPQSIFFNVKTEIDPLNVQNVNENCANLSPDVILVRFLFKTLTYAIMEIDKCNDVECADLNLECDESNDNHRLLYKVCVNIICQVKHMLHLKNDCLFPLTSKTAQNILHNEQSGLNTGLYSPEENIPLDILNLICLRSAHRIPLLLYIGHIC
ncbi:Huntingtin [Eumeta japonica]|uniref:Huntingtin n=1 Tax=Eumeta variegata TaxID=151549 RepID=A0A4C1UQU8_EUMVA|nr:Huntingtin [Eumeta japonica]